MTSAIFEPDGGMMTIRYARLTSDDRATAKQVFAMMAEVFAEGYEPLTDGYVARLLSDDSFWAIAAFHDAEPVGGVTAHVLPMTRNESAELFIYDVAIRSDYQRRGIGRGLIALLREHASKAGIDVAFVPADNEDEHALDFYSALGGEPTAVTFFTFSGPGAQAAPAMDAQPAAH